MIGQLKTLNSFTDQARALAANLNSWVGPTACLESGGGNRQAFPEVIVKIGVFYLVTLFSLVDIYQGFEGTCCLHSLS